MNQKTIEYRQKIADSFLEVLKEKNLNWKKQWKVDIPHLPINAVTNSSYKGINLFWLMFNMQAQGWTDPRFVTFKQIQDKGWHLLKGSQGLNVEYWMPYDTKIKKVISWEDYNKISSDDKKHIKLTVKYFTVFHASMINGMPEYVKNNHPEITVDEAVKKISRNMEIEIINDGGNRAFYRPSEDKIHLPLPKFFETDYAYNSTALHELAHATGASHRLNRNISNPFGSLEYAYEELVAEISSCFTSHHIQAEQSEFDITNHKAYVKGWIKSIEENPEVLIKAIKDANQVANYLEYKAELIPEHEYKKSAFQNSINIPTEHTSSEPGSPEVNTIQKMFIDAGYKPTKTLITNMCVLNNLVSITQIRRSCFNKKRRFFYKFRSASSSK